MFYFELVAIPKFADETFVFNLSMWKLPYRFYCLIRLRYVTELYPVIGLHLYAPTQIPQFDVVNILQILFSQGLGLKNSSLHIPARSQSPTISFLSVYLYTRHTSFANMNSLPYIGCWLILRLPPIFSLTTSKVFWTAITSGYFNILTYFKSYHMWYLFIFLLLLQNGQAW